MVRPNNWGNIVYIIADDGGVFDLTSIDYAAYSSDFDATIIGTKADSSTVSVNIASASKSSLTETLNWTELYEVKVDYSGGANNRFGVLDNIIAEPAAGGGGSEQVLSMTEVAASSGWNSSSKINDGDTGSKATVSSSGSGKYLEYSITESTITRARMHEDNDGGWNVDEWKLEYYDGSWKTAFDWTAEDDTEGWNEIDFTDKADVTAVRFWFMDDDNNAEIFELELYGITGGSSSSTSIGFEDLVPNSKPADYSSDGFYFYTLSSVYNLDNLNVEGSSDGFSSLVLIPGNWGGKIYIEKLDYSSFDLVSFEHAAISQGNVSDATITGTKSDLSTVTATISSTTKNLSLETLNWTDLIEVEIDYEGGAHNRYGAIDNVVLE